MVRKSNDSRSKIIESFGEAIQAFQESTDAFDDSAAYALGLNRTDLKCLAIVAKQRSVSASEIARQVKITKGAMTTALDRAEASGYLRREADPDDKRGIRLSLTAKATRAIDKIWGPFKRNSESYLKGYSTADLELITKFLSEASKGQLIHAERVRSLGEN